MHLFSVMSLLLELARNSGCGGDVVELGEVLLQIGVALDYYRRGRFTILLSNNIQIWIL